MNIAKLLLIMVGKMRPILVYIIPIEKLRDYKKRFVTWKLKKVESGEKNPFDPDKYPKGVNLIGNIRAEMGLGQSCRLVANQFENSNINYSINNYSISTNILRENDHSFDNKISKDFKYSINLFHINPYELRMAYLEIGTKTLDYRYNIVFWLWELEEFPVEWMECLPLVDEIWTPSNFTSTSIKKITDKPVFTIPYCVSVISDKKYSRDYYGLPNDKFLFLIMFDSNSTMDRKNPMGAVEAFKKAYDKSNNHVGLVIKINNCQEKDLLSLKESLYGYENVYYITQVLEKIKVNSLIGIVDVFVSLHRAEGFGLVLAESMLLGTPTIATNWSSNTEFMNNEVACMVEYEFTIIQEDSGVYKKGCRWAEPNISQAADYMRLLASDTDKYNKIKLLGKTHIEKVLSMGQAVDLMEERIAEIYTVM